VGRPANRSPQDFKFDVSYLCCRKEARTALARPTIWHDRWGLVRILCFVKRGAGVAAAQEVWPMDPQDARKRLEDALSEVVRNDRHLFETDANERTIAGRLAMYLQQRFVEYTCVPTTVPRFAAHTVHTEPARNDGRLTRSSSRGSLLLIRRISGAPAKRSRPSAREPRGNEWRSARNCQSDITASRLRDVGCSKSCAFGQRHPLELRPARSGTCEVVAKKVFWASGRGCSLPLAANG